MRAILLSFTVAALVSSGAAFKCYRCVYHEDIPALNTGCNNDGDKIPEAYLLPCDEYPPEYEDADELGYQCIKMTGTIIDKDDNEFKYVKRDCSFGNTTFDADCQESSAITTESGTLHKGNLCHCNGEGCNSGKMFQQNFVMVFLFGLAASVFRHAF